MTLHRTTGALATKARPAAVAFAVAAPGTPFIPLDMARAIQGSLFPERPSANVIPIESFAAPPVVRSAPTPKPAPRPRPSTASTPAKPAPHHAARVAEGQGKLDFLPSAPPKPRTLSTTVEAVIYCEAPVASSTHRAVAAAIDWTMVMIAYGLFLLTFHLCGGEFAITRNTLPVFGAAFLLVGFTYGIYWTVAGTETAGMRWTQLRLITFGGFPLEGRHRIMRFAGACLSRCTGLGLLWSLADEENLAWQDHISGTFPTPYELESRIFQRR
ncbi:MAG: RDD family protein [Bryobacteraceae bacterium]